MASNKPPSWIIELVSEDVLLCVPGSVGSDHCCEPAGDSGSDQRCVCALEIWQIRPGGSHTHT